MAEVDNANVDNTKVDDTEADKGENPDGDKIAITMIIVGILLFIIGFMFPPLCCIAYICIILGSLNLKDKITFDQTGNILYIIGSIIFLMSFFMPPFCLVCSSFMSLAYSLKSID